MNDQQRREQDRRNCEFIRVNVYRTMVEQGYIDRVARAGSELERWVHYLKQLGQAAASASHDPMVPQPRIFPMMEGLPCTPWHDPSGIPAAAVLEQSIDIIRQEIASLDASQFISYPSGITTSGQWTVLPLFVFGEEVGSFLYPRNNFSRTAKIIRDLPDACPDLALADVIFSAHAPHTHLAAHSSWDPFRVRLHLGIQVPENCRIRVGNETREWKEGKTLAFSEAYEHETWNDSHEARIVLIVDFWNAHLTAAERRAIRACFRKREIRSILMRTRAPEPMQPIFERKFRDAEQRDSVIAEFWAR